MVSKDLKAWSPRHTDISPGEGWTLHQDIGLIALIGPIWERPDAGGLSLGFRADERHINRGDFVHGGMLMTLLDHALGMAVLDGKQRQAQATIQLDTHFLATVHRGEFVEARSIVERRTRSLVFMSGMLHVGDRLVCTGNGVWKLLATKPRKISR